jgi:HSP20 family molecular chaperone IbpA
LTWLEARLCLRTKVGLDETVRSAARSDTERQAMGSDELRNRMWHDALSALARAEQLQRQMFRLATPPERLASWEPPVDVFEDAASVVVVAALPGVNESAVRLAVDAGDLVISGERTLPAELRTAVIHRLELPQGVFERRVRLPPGRYDEVRRRTLDGCLVVTLRKHP